MAKANQYLIGMVVRLGYFQYELIMQSRGFWEEIMNVQVAWTRCWEKRWHAEFWKHTLITLRYDTLAFFWKCENKYRLFNLSVFPRFQVEKLLDLSGIGWLDVLRFHVAARQQKLLKVLHVAAVSLRRCLMVDHRGWIILPDDTLCLLLDLK